MSDPQTPTCPVCGNRIGGQFHTSILSPTGRELYEQTPIEVWQHYHHEGYTLPQALKMEFSYAE